MTNVIDVQKTNKVVKKYSVIVNAEWPSRYISTKSVFGAVIFTSKFNLLSIYIHL